MTTKTIYPYVRFSNGEQRKGDSLRRQLTLIDEYAERYGYRVNDQLGFRDLGKSAWEGDNLKVDAGLGRFLMAIETGHIPTDGSSFLCVEQLDRLTRKNIREANALFERILSKNVNIITLMDSKVYTKDSLDNFMETVYSLFLMNQSFIESEKKSERVKASFVGRLEKIKKGEKAKYASQIPSWLDEVEPKTNIFKKNNKAKVVQRIFKLAIEDITLNDIARVLNKERIPRITRSNYKNGTGIWTGSVVSHIIKNRCVIGKLDVYKYKKVEDEKNGIIRKERYLHETIEDYYPRIITDEDFDTANRRVTVRKTTKERGRKSNNNIFTSLLYCGDCLQRIHFEMDVKELKSGVKEYKCLKCYSRRFSDSCPSVTIRYEQLEKCFPRINMCSDAGESEAIKAKVSLLQKDLDKSEAESKRIKRRISDVENDAVDNDIPFRKYSSILAKLQSKLEEELKKQSRIISDIRYISSDAPEHKYDLSKEKDREAAKHLIRSRISGIIIYTRENTGWVLFKNGEAQTINLGRNDLTMTMFKFKDFINDMRAKIAIGNVDPKLEKLANSIEYWED